MWRQVVRRRQASDASGFVQPRRFHGLVYINALTLSTVLLVFAAQTLLLLPQSTAPTAAAQPVATLQTPTNPPPPAELAPNQFAVSATVAPHQSSALPDCASQSYALPSRLENTQLPDGVHITQDPPQSYPVFGTATDRIRADVERCSPIHGTSGERYTATTGYAFGIYYSTLQMGAVCRPTHVVITLHINQLFPAWQSAASSTAAVRANWSRFSANLQLHEQGHVARDTAAAEALLAQLQALQANDCNTLSIQISAQTAATMRSLAADNDNYDGITKHGTTQGAVL